MAVIGIDIGFQNCFVAGAIKGGIEMIANDYSERCTPVLVSFRNENRKFGSGAKDQVIMNYKNTIFGIKSLIGREYNDSYVQSLIDQLPFTIEKHKNGKDIGIRVRSQNQDKCFTPIQVYAMFLRHVVDTTEKSIKGKVNSAVLSVPIYYSDAERRGVLDAAKIASIHCPRLINDTNSVALAYGIYKKDLPEDSKTPRNVAFVDIGYFDIQVSIFAFSAGKGTCIVAEGQPFIGGWTFDKKIFDHFSAEFKQKYKLDVLSNPKATLKLLKECEKLKALMSANTIEIPLNIECFMDDIDVSGHIGRKTFELLSEDVLAGVESILQSVLTRSKLKPEDIFAIELVGGCSRIPAIKSLVSKIFLKEPSTTLNLDEAIARGCAIQSAMLSPTLNVRNFSISGVIPYAIRLSWTDQDSGDKGEMLAFKEGSAANLSKVLNFYRKAEFSIDAHYAETDRINYPNPLIGTFIVKNVKPTQEGEASKVKVKFRVDNSGLLVVPNVELIEKLIVEVEEPVAAPVAETAKNETQTEPMASENASTEKCQEKNEINDQMNLGESSKETVPEIVEKKEEIQTKEEQPPITESPMEVENSAVSSEEPKKLEKKTKEVLTSIILPVTENVNCLNQVAIDLAQEVQAQLISQDNYQIEKANAKNSLEEYVFEMRDKLDTILEQFVTEILRAQLKENLNRIDEWLYEEGDNVEPSLYKEKLSALRIECDPIQKRYNESSSRPAAFDNIGKNLIRFRKALEEYNAGSEAYNHLEAENMKTVETAVNEKQQWMEKQLNSQNSRALYQDPVVTTSEINRENENLSNTCQPIITKPKPKPKEEVPKDITPPKTNDNNVETATPAFDFEKPMDQTEPGPIEDTVEIPDKSLELD